MDLHSTKDTQLANKIIYFGEVISIVDEFESRTIQVKIPAFDSRIENEDLAPCYPLLPAFFHVVPQVGERVVIIMDRIYNADSTMNQEKRYYLSPTISQPQNLKFDPYYYTASANETDGWTKRSSPISANPTAKGTYMEKDQIGMVGRDNTDIILKAGEVLLRAGKHEKDNVTIFNRKDPAFIQIRYGIENSSKETKTKTITSVELIDPEYAINVSSDSNNNLIVNVKRLKDNSIVDEFKEGYNSREELITASKAQIITFQNTYAKWQLRTSEAELAKLETIFPNNQKIVKKKVEQKEQNEFDEFAGSVMNLVAEKINLLSHKSAKNYNLTDPTKQIDEDTQLEINSTAHPMVFGDKLKEFLELLKLFVETHVHPYHGLPVSQDEIVKKLLNYNLDELLDMNIRLG